MTLDEKLEAKLRCYILGQLSEPDEKAFEEKLMSDDTMFIKAESLVDLVEDQLVDEYQSGELDEPERSGFEQRLLSSPGIREKLLLASSLSSYAKKASGAGSLLPDTSRTWKTRVISWVKPLLAPAPALALSIAILFISGMTWSLMTIADLESQHDSRARAGTVAAILNPGLDRSSGKTPTILTTADHRLVELHLDLGVDAYRSYRAVLVNAAGEEMVIQNGLGAAARGDQVFVIVQFPRSIFQSGDYIVKLAGVTPAGTIDMLDSYYFQLRIE